MGARDVVGDLGGVAADVADRRVYLRESYAQQVRTLRHVSIMATAAERQVEVALRPDVVLEVPPLAPVGAEAEALHRIPERQAVAEDAPGRVVGVCARAERVVAAHAEALAITEAGQRGVDRAAGVVAAATGDVGAHEVAAAAPARPAHECAGGRERA